MFPDTPETREIDAFLSKYCTRGILLHRPYPPLGFGRVRSRLGGLPTLPDGTEWPMGWIIDDEGDDIETPLHFLAQIDCSELPRVDQRLPATGMLFFFALEDEEMILTYGEFSDGARVIYAPHVPAGQPPRQPPAGLRPIGEAFASQDPYTPSWLLPGEDGPAVHFSWPLVPLAFDTWPDLQEANWEWDDKYAARVGALRAASFVAATGSPTCSQYTPFWEKNWNGPLLLPQAGADGRAFPQAGIMIDRTARLLIRKTLHAQAADEPLVAALRVQAYEWLERASKIGLDSAPSDTDAEGFQLWLKEIAKNEKAPSYLRFALPRLLTEALLCSIALAGGNEKIAGLIPSDFYDVLENSHIPVFQKGDSDSETGTRWRLETRVHQMLGYAPVTQGVMEIGSDTVCLLQLASDPTLDLMFGDVGEVTFWIKDADLAEMRFDKAWAEMTCH